MAGTTHNLYIRGQDDTRAAITSAKRNFRSLETSVKAVSATLAGIAGAAGFGALLANVTKTADEVGKLSTRLGASTEALSQYRFVAEQTGVSFQTLTTGIQRLTRRASEAAAGTKTYANALAELGINAQRFAELRPEQQFEVLATALDRVENSSRRVALAQKLLDSEGVALLQTMEGGAEAIQKLRQRADELGLTLDRETAQAAADVRDRFSEMSGRIQGATLTLAERFLPTLDRGLTFVVDKVIPGFVNFARALGLVDEQLENLSTRELRRELEELTTKVFAEEIAAEENSLITRLQNAFGFDAEQRIVKYRQRVAEIQELLASRGPEGSQIGIDFMGGGDAEGVFQPPWMPKTDEQHQNDLDAKTQQNQDLIDLEGKFYDAWLAGVKKGQENIFKEETKGIKKRKDFALWQATDQQKSFFQILTSTTQGVAQHNRVLFELNKVGAIANAAIAALEGPAITEGSYPWPLGNILAGIHYASGIARVAAIAATSYGGGGGGSAPSLATGGTPVTPVTETGETIAGAAAGGIPGEEPEPPAEITVNFNGIADANSIRELIDAINEEQSNGYVLTIA